MKKLFALLLCLSLIIPAGITARADGTTVYVDPTGATAGAYDTLQAAANALPSGGTIIVKADADTNAANTATTVTATGPIRVEGETQSIRLSLTRALSVDCPSLVIDNITLVNSSKSTYDFFYAKGHDLTIGSHVTTVKSSSNRFLSIFAGNPSTACTSTGTISVNSGSWNSFYCGNNASTKAFSGTLTYELNGVTANKLFLTGLTGTSTATVTANVTNSTITEITKTSSSGVFNGTSYITLKSGTVSTVTNLTPDIDLSAGGTLSLGGSVTAGSITGGGRLTLSDGATVAADSFTGDLALVIPSPETDKTYLTVNDPACTGTVSYTPAGTEILERAVSASDVTYTVRATAPAPTTVYLDPAGTGGHTENVFTTLGDAAAALAAEGGTIIVCSDVNVNVDSDTHFHMAAKPIHITGETGTERITQLRSWYINDSLIIDNITWVNSAVSTYAFIYCQGHDLTVGNNVTTLPNGSTYLCILAGSANVTNAVGTVNTGNATITIKSGTFRRVFGGGLGAAYHGSVNIVIDGGSVNNCIYLAGSASAGTSNATASITVKSGTVANITPNSDSGVFSGSSTVTLCGGTVSNLNGLTPDIDLSDGGTLTLGAAMAVRTITGGGTLALGRTAAVTADSMTGSITLRVANYEDGLAYLTIYDENTAGTVTYIPAGSEIMNRTVTNGTVQYTISAPRTHVKLTGYNPDGDAAEQPTIRLYKGYSTDDDYTQITDTTAGTDDGYKKYLEADLAPGLYCFLINYASPYSHMRQYFYISGSEADTVEIERTFLPYTASNYEEKSIAYPTPQVTENFWNFANTNVQDFTLVTPTFTMEKYTRNNRAFMNNEDMCAFVDSLSSPYLHVYYPFEVTELGNRAPVLVFTKDAVPSGITLDDLAREINSGSPREVLMMVGNQHGNEPSGTDGSLQVAYDLCGAYGEDVLDSFAAIVIIPSVSLDNNQRFTREYPDGLNSNRDLLYQSKAGSRYIAYVYSRFMPSVFISVHEDNEQNAVDTTDNSIADMRGMSYECSAAPNSPIVDVEGLVDGSVDILQSEKVQIMNRLITKAQQQGFRCMHYYAPSIYPVAEMAYGGIRGSYSFLIENQRMLSGKNNYEYTVKQATTGIKNVIGEIMTIDSTSPRTIAEKVAEGRENAKVSQYDPNRRFVLNMSSSVGGTDPSPSVYVDGTYKDASAVSNWRFYTTVTASRTLPASYVIPADLAHIADILDVLDAHGISYARIENGATHTLKKYTMACEDTDVKKTTATIGDNAEVTFANGAYEVSLNTPDAYLIAYLFEPDCEPSGTYYASFVDMGFIGIDEALYRNETTKITDGEPAEDLVFTTASLELENKLTIGFGFDRPVSDSGYYSDIHAVFTVDGKEIDVTDYAEVGDKCVFRLKGIAPDMMNDTVKGRIYAMHDGVQYAGDELEYSVADYCLGLLAGTTDADAELRTLVVDMLNYGTAAQAYTGHNADNLVNARLSPGQAAWGTSDDPVMVNNRVLSVSNGVFSPVDAPAVSWKGASLNLSDTIALRFVFEADSTDGVEIRVQDAAGTVLKTITAGEFVAADGGRLSVKYGSLIAGQMSDVFYVTAYSGGNAVSNTLAYSIESYACAKQNSTYPGLAALVKAMMKYGNAASAYILAGRS